MHLFWNTIIEPLLRALKVRRILEIGSDDGHNTRHLLDYCQEVDGFLEVIDPLPKYDPETWFEPWPGRVGFHRDLSLNVLSQIAPTEVVLIDGDHNWYTVYHELKLIDKTTRQAGQPFPLVLLHDIGWPYGRRDLYYDPDTIPVGHRKPYRNQGLQHGESKLAETGGLNAHLCNSIYEHNHQNGVLTAVEDFLAEIGDELRFEQLPGIHGLGILYPATLEDHDGFAQFMLEISPTPRQRQFMEMLEAQRLILQVTNAEQGFALRALQRQDEQRTAHAQATEQEHAALAGQLTAMVQERDALTERLNISETDRALLTARLETAETERTALADRLVHSEQTRHALSQQFTQAETERSNLEQMLAQAEGERTDLEQKLTQAESARADLKRHLAQTEAERAALTQKNANLTQQITAAEQDHASLTQKLTQAESERADLKRHLAQTEAERAALTQKNANLTQQITAAEQDHASLTQKLTQAESERADLNRHLAQIKAERTALAQKNANLTQRLATLNANLTTIRAQSDKRVAEQEKRLTAQARRTADVETALQRYRDGFRRLEQDYQAVRTSARWKVGHRVVRPLEILLLRGKPPLVIDHMGEIFAAARSWGPRPSSTR